MHRRNVRSERQLVHERSVQDFLWTLVERAVLRLVTATLPWVTVIILVIPLDG